MKSLHVVGPFGDRWLMRRDYACQGERPDYDRLCRIDEFEAHSLVSGHIAEPWFNDADFGVRAVDPRGLLSVSTDGRTTQVRLVLPNLPPRNSAFELELPEGERILRFLRSQDGGLPDGGLSDGGGFEPSVGPAGPKRPSASISERWI